MAAKHRIRVHQIAKEMGITSSEVISGLKEIGIPAKSHMSSITQDEYDKFIEYMTIKREIERRKREKEEKAKKALEVKEEVKQGEKLVAETVEVEEKPQKVKEKPAKAAEEVSVKEKVKEEKPPKKKPPKKKTVKKEEKRPKEETPKVEKVAPEKVEEIAKKFEKKEEEPVEEHEFEVIEPLFTPVKSRRKRRKKKRREEIDIEEVRAEELRSRVDMETGTIKLPETVTIKDLVFMLEADEEEIQELLKSKGIPVTLTQVLPFDVAKMVCEEYGFEVLPEEEELLGVLQEEEDEENLVPRPPVVTVMGHVDHGKTTLLDYIRKTNVAAREAGGITQHIGAYKVKLPEGEITFIDTPGHHAFTTMRARGARVTDIVILVVAADDGVMPQTVEAINHAKAAGVPIIVAINKIDKPEANPERVKQELSKYGLIPEEWGGDTIMVPISAKTGQGVDELLEMVLLQAEMLELKANPNKPARGTVLESKLDPKRGPVATLLVQDGTLRVGDALVAGLHWGKVRAMTNELGQRLKEAGPSTPVEVLGLSDVPLAGEPFFVVDNERKAREISEERKERAKEALQEKPRLSLEEIMKKLTEGEAKELRIVLKADVQGSLEAVKEAIEKLSNDEVSVKVIHSGVGAITETDVMLAEASGAIIIGFNVRPDSKAKKLAEQDKVEIRTYRVIYELLDDVKKAMAGMLEPEYQEVVLGRAEVRQVFNVPKVGKVAGCYVLEGKITRNANIRVLRDGVIIHEGKLSSLKRFKDDVREVAAGYECGMAIEGFNDVKEGDIIEAYEVQEVQREL
ncbi:translation initiation factor IF-2 [Thermosulfidibacter takaii ABI70S6]|uniref:Translation initiation factor IF-2 n=1 Tax=Thermosulfidibacter takaii (strain DSM 17441 / JCM 13301 / NBRC 103674 / ABI70S6) TaxID=1298851 RepID=A0A0S3QRL4_THET7|nr:translation initiation factor IF-2 [Thermosulfidibacter takaii]BAT70913.1 translation initiation factor IF-2 [Thermosulfidibacter takaii ABI70S6]